MLPDKNPIASLEARIRELEDVERFTIDALEMAASLGDFQSSINKSLDNSIILALAKQRICGLIPFEETFFFLVDENSHDFVMVGDHAKSKRSYIQGQVNKLIDNGTFAWALREKRPVTVHTTDQKKQLILHVMTTSSRVRGMFVGLLQNDSVGAEVAVCIGHVISGNRAHGAQVSRFGRGSSSAGLRWNSNPKAEIRKPKEIRNPKAEGSKPCAGLRVLDLSHFPRFGFASVFRFRLSDLSDQSGRACHRPS